MDKSIRFPAGAAFFPAPGKFVDGGPGTGFRSFRAGALLLVSGLNVFRLTLLLVRVTGFITLRHGGSLIWLDRFAFRRRYRQIRY